jgi:GNAT superfamily N-acetyltransferase
METLQIISWKEFQEGIAVLWNSENPKNIPIYNNPFGLIQYHIDELLNQVIYFPCKYLKNNEIVGYISIYNISNKHIRPRGIYILPDFRGKGLGHRMQRAAWDLFPKSFYRTFIITAQVERFCKYSNMYIYPNILPLYSEFSNAYLRLLCFQRQYNPSLSEIDYNKKWISNNIAQFGYAGKNNLNTKFTSIDWENYVKEHKGNYQSVNFNLDI